MASDAGTIGLTPEEREQFRRYLPKGGFLWVDDFWGSAAWEHWAAEIARVLPPSDYLNHRCAVRGPRSSHAAHRRARAEQITNIQFWRSVGGASDIPSEAATAGRPLPRHPRQVAGHGGDDAADANDIADSWEREGEDPAFFRQFSPAGYAFGINVLLHGMTH